MDDLEQPDQGRGELSIWRQQYLDRLDQMAAARDAIGEEEFAKLYPPSPEYLEDVKRVQQWEAKMRSLGLWERHEERKSISLKLSAEAQSLGIYHNDEHARALGFDEWLSAPVMVDECNYSSCRRLVLRQDDRWLFEHEPVPAHPDSIYCYLFDWDDVVALRDSGQVTTQEEWDALVDGRYRAAWQQYHDQFHEKKPSAIWWT